MGNQRVSSQFVGAKEGYVDVCRDCSLVDGGMAEQGTVAGRIARAMGEDLAPDRVSPPPSTDERQI